MKRHSLVILLLLSSSAFAQNKIDQGTVDALQYGVACKLNMEFQSGASLLNFKLSVSAGIGYDIEDINLFPALHTGVLLFNKGTIGSSLKEHWSKIRAHFFYSAIGTIKLDQRNYNYVDRYVPFYHFSDFSANPLQNPYKSSFSMGTVWVRMPDRIKQRLGIINVNVAGRAQLNYYNDGGPVLKCLGDKRDRYYTGGLLLSYHGNEKAAIDQVEISYHKFTGYAKHAFDIGDKLQMDFLVYADPEQFTFNQQRWKINVSDLSSGFSANVSLYDVNNLDLQDFLHFNSNVPYHPDYYNGWRLAIGGKYEYNYLSVSQ